MRLHVPNFSKYNPRADVKNPTWIRLERDWWMDPKLEGSGPVAKLVWPFILSKANFETCIAEFSATVAIAALEISPHDLDAALTELKQRNLVSSLDDVTDTYGHVRTRTDTGVTDGRTERDERDERDGTDERVGGFGPRDLAALWNELAGPMHPKVDLARLKSGTPRWTAAKARLAADPDPAYWREVVTRFVAWPHGRGETPGKNGGPPWVANFDFLLKPNTHVRAMEGDFTPRQTKGSRSERDAGLEAGHQANWLTAEGGA